jgi:methylaspartate mutase sigma subunit
MEPRMTPMEEGEVEGRPGVVVVTGVASDSHTWNLVFLQLLIEELGHHVVNLGPCVPDELLIAECQRLGPAMVVVSSVNGHGYQDGMRLIDKLRACEELATTPVVIGGKLGISGEQDLWSADELVAAGFDAVFDDSRTGIAAFREFSGTLPPPTPALPPRERSGARS